MTPEQPPKLNWFWRLLHRLTWSKRQQDIAAGASERDRAFVEYLKTVRHP